MSSCCCISIHSLARGRTKGGIGIADECVISIHSLARGRTFRNLLPMFRIFPFQSTPSQEGEQFKIIFNFSIINFNPLPRKRENNGKMYNDETAEISIHSLARGRTWQ